MSNDVLPVNPHDNARGPGPRLIGERWDMADVSSAPGSKLVLEGPLTDEWNDRTYRAATYPRNGGDLIDEAYGPQPEDALLALLKHRSEKWLDT